MIEVRPLRPGDEDAYTAFVTGHPDALVYHTLPYRDLLLEHLGCEAEYLVALQGGDVRGVLPAMWASADGARILNSLPYFGSPGAPLAAGEAIAAALLAAWNERATDAGTAAATLVANPFRPGAAPVHDLGDERINQATPLAGVAGSEAALLARAEPSAGRNLRKARRLGVEVGREADALDELAAIHAENMARIGGRARDPGFFAATARHLRPGADYDVYTARLGGEVVAGLLVSWLGAAAEYLVPAVREQHRSDQPLAAVLARALVDAAERGLAWWNWGGSWPSQQGVQRFKRKWGGRRVTYRYYVKLNDRALLEQSPEALQERFGHFFVVPYAALTR
jgi:hypothetical protein